MPLLAGISACLIVKDEEELLPECLASLVGAVDEICVLDTGSLDGTRALALSAGARVEDFAWIQDFSAARNASLAMARHEWILVVDADERLNADSRDALRRCTASEERLAFLVKRLDLRPEGTPDVIALPRLFRNHPAIRFRRPVHEDVMDALYELGETLPPTSAVELLHVGYLPQVLQKVDKLGRNLQILRARFALEPADLFNTYKLATSLPFGEERSAALEVALVNLKNRSLEELSELPFLPRLLHAAAREAWAQGKLSRALALCEEGIALFNDAVLLLALKAELLGAAGHYELARALLSHLEQPMELDAARGESALGLKTSLARLQIRIALESRSELPEISADAFQDVGVACGVLRYQLRAGAIDFVSATLGELLETQFAEDAVKLACGELALARNDLTTAKAVFSATDARTDAGNEAHSLLALLQQRAGEPFALPSARFASQAGLVHCLAGHATQANTVNARAAAATLDPLFVPEQVKQWQAIWEQELGAL